MGEVSVGTERDQGYAPFADDGMGGMNGWDGEKTRRNGGFPRNGGCDMTILCRFQCVSNKETAFLAAIGIKDG